MEIQWVLCQPEVSQKTSLLNLNLKLGPINLTNTILVIIIFFCKLELVFLNHKHHLGYVFL
jgi:hypothetical protein